MKYDLIIIGDGSVDAAAGYYAARAGLNVLMTDAHMPPHQHGSHRGDTQLICHAYGGGEKYVPLILRAQTLWDELSRYNEDDPVSVRSGVINLGPADSVFLANVAHSVEQWQLNAEKLDAQGIMVRWSGVRVPDNYIGLSETDPGFLRDELMIKARIQLAKEADRMQLFNCPVTAIRHDNDGVTAETVDDGYQAKKAIICAGTWVKDLLPELPVQPVHKVFAWYQADGRYSMKNKFPASTGEPSNGDQYYGSPAENGVLEIGKYNGGQITHSANKHVPFAEMASDGSEAFPFLRNILPDIGRCLYGVTCTYDNLPDEDSIISTLPGHGNMLLITGLSGHGFKFASVLGETAADFAQNKKGDSDLMPLRFSRFQWSSLRPPE